MVVRLDVRHWLHRWDAVVIKQSHVKYGPFMSALAGAILAYNRDDMLRLVGALKRGKELYSQYTDEQMLSFVKPHQLKSYVRRVTRGVEVSFSNSVASVGVNERASQKSGRANLAARTPGNFLCKCLFLRRVRAP